MPQLAIYAQGNASNVRPPFMPGPCVRGCLQGISTLFIGMPTACSGRYSIPRKTLLLVAMFTKKEPVIGAVMQVDPWPGAQCIEQCKGREIAVWFVQI